jgi:hypothetical protein
MAEPQNIWMYTSNRELIRSDRLVSLLYDDQGIRTGGVRARLLGGFRQDTMRTVSLLECAEDYGLQAIAGLAVALGQAAACSGPAVFVYAVDAADGVPQWQVSNDWPYR